MKRIDEFLYDPKKLPFRGWYDDHPSFASTPSGPYRGAIQQVRSEFEELLRRALAQGLHGTAVQIGLGITGGTHFALRQVFDRVISIDINPENIARFKSFHTPDPQRDIIVHGSSRDMGIVNHVQQLAR